MNTEETNPPAVVLSTALLDRIDDLSQWFTDNPNHNDIKDALTALVRDVAYDSSPNAEWLTLAHLICADAGIAPGHIAQRLRILRDQPPGYRAGTKQGD